MHAALEERGPGSRRASGRTIPGSVSARLRARRGSSHRTAGALKRAAALGALTALAAWACNAPITFEDKHPRVVGTGGTSTDGGSHGGAGGEGSGGRDVSDDGGRG